MSEISVEDQIEKLKSLSIDEIDSQTEQILQIQNLSVQNLVSIRDFITEHTTNSFLNYIEQILQQKQEQELLICFHVCIELCCEAQQALNILKSLACNNPIVLSAFQVLMANIINEDFEVVPANILQVISLYLVKLQGVGTAAANSFINYAQYFSEELNKKHPEFQKIEIVRRRNIYQDDAKQLQTIQQFSLLKDLGDMRAACIDIVIKLFIDNTPEIDERLTTTIKLICQCIIPDDSTIKFAFGVVLKCFETQQPHHILEILADFIQRFLHQADPKPTAAVISSGITLAQLRLVRQIHNNPLLTSLLLSSVTKSVQNAAIFGLSKLSNVNKQMLSNLASVTAEDMIYFKEYPLVSDSTQSLVVSSLLYQLACLLTGHLDAISDDLLKKVVELSTNQFDTPECLAAAANLCGAASFARSDFIFDTILIENIVNALLAVQFESTDRIPIYLLYLCRCIELASVLKLPTKVITNIKFQVWSHFSYKLTSHMLVILDQIFKLMQNCDVAFAYQLAVAGYLGCTGRQPSVIEQHDELPDDISCFIVTEQLGEEDDRYYIESQYLKSLNPEFFKLLPSTQILTIDSIQKTGFVSEHGDYLISNMLMIMKQKALSPSLVYFLTICGDSINFKKFGLTDVNYVQQYAKCDSLSQVATQCAENSLQTLASVSTHMFAFLLRTNILLSVYKQCKPDAQNKFIIANAFRLALAFGTAYECDPSAVQQLCIEWGYQFRKSQHDWANQTNELIQFVLGRAGASFVKADDAYESGQLVEQILSTSPQVVETLLCDFVLNSPSLSVKQLGSVPLLIQASYCFNHQAAEQLNRTIDLIQNALRPFTQKLPECYLLTSTLALMALHPAAIGCAERLADYRGRQCIKILTGEAFLLSLAESWVIYYKELADLVAHEELWAAENFRQFVLVVVKEFTRTRELDRACYVYQRMAGIAAIPDQQEFVDRCIANWTAESQAAVLRYVNKCESNDHRLRAIARMTNQQKADIGVI